MIPTATGVTETTFASEDWRSRPQDDGPFADLPASLDKVDRLRPVAERVGCTLAQLALAWNVHQPGVTSAIAGSRNAEHVRANALAGDIELDDATLAELDAIVA